MNGTNFVNIKSITKTSVMTFIVLMLIISLQINITEAFKGHVVKVYDGDTITVIDSETGVSKKVRLFGIDAPEINPRQDYGKDSKALLKSVVFDKDVEVIEVMTDRWLRIVGVVYLKMEKDQVDVTIDKISVNEYMIRKGAAWVYPYYWNHYKNKLKIESDWILLESDAKDSKSGLWGVSNYVAPWDYRSAH